MLMLTSASSDEEVKLKMQNTNSSPYDKSAGYRAVLKNRNFLHLWLAQVFSQLGDRVIFVVFVAAIAAKFGTSTTMQSWLYVAFTIPAILLTAIAGVFIDRWSKKQVLISTNILRAILIGFLPLFSSTLFGIYALAFLVSCATQFFVPAEASAIPTLVKKHQLLAANSLFTTTMMASIIFGTVLGDPLINIFGMKTVHWSISALFLIAASFLSFVRLKNNETKETLYKRTLKDFLEELKQGIKYIRSNTPILQAMLKLSALFSIVIILSILAIGISQEKLYPDNPVLGAQKFVYIVASSGIGMVFSSLLAGKIWRNKDKYKLIYSGFSIIGVSLLLLSLVGMAPQTLCLHIKECNFINIYFAPFDLTFRMIYAYVVSSFIGFGCALVAIPVQTILHSSINETMRGKAFGVQFTLLSSFSALSAILAGKLGDILGVTKLITIIGIPISLFGFYNLLRIKFFQD